VLYLDASAIVKLVRREPETLDLVEEIRRDPDLVSSELSWTEVLRAIVRVRGDTARAEAILADIALVPVDGGILRAAAALTPPTLRTLDAIHLATALSLGADLDRVITYDSRLAEATSAAGAAVSAPGTHSGAN
jgi:uncharacterized protein